MDVEVLIVYKTRMGCDLSMKVREILQFIVLVAAVAGCQAVWGCQSGSARPSPSGVSVRRPVEAVTLLVIGDIQLMGDYRLKMDGEVRITEQDLKEARLDTKTLARADLHKIVLREKPVEILSTGDLVDLNNGQKFIIKNLRTGVVRELRFAADEWKETLSFFPRDLSVFPAVGNHETYEEITFSFEEAGDGTLKFLGVSKVSLLEAAEVKALVSSRFPHLSERNRVRFKGGDGTYFADRGKYCLLSLDLNFVKKADPLRVLQDFKDFIVSSREWCASAGRHEARPIIAISHHPFMKGFVSEKGDPDEDFLTEMVKIFNENNVALSVSGHEHHYLRYNRAGLNRTGQAARQSAGTIFWNNGTFGSPWFDETVTRFFRKARIAHDIPMNPDSTWPVHRLNELPVFKFHGRELVTHLEDTYSLIRILPGKITVSSRGFHATTGSWSEIDEFSVQQDCRGRWGPGASRYLAP